VPQIACQKGGKKDEHQLLSRGVGRGYSKQTRSSPYRKGRVPFTSKKEKGKRYCPVLTKGSRPKEAATFSTTNIKEKTTRSDQKEKGEKNGVNFGGPACGRRGGEKMKRQNHTYSLPEAKEGAGRFFGAKEGRGQTSFQVRMKRRKTASETIKGHNLCGPTVLP